MGQVRIWEMASITTSGGIGRSPSRTHGGTARLAAALDSAGLDVRVGELLVGIVGGSVVLFGIGFLLASPLIALVLALIVPLIARVVVVQMARRRKKRFADQLADTLQMLAGSLRAGHSLAQAIDTVAREAESPTCEEFRRVTVETRLGRDFVEALSSMRARVGNEDLEWVVEAGRHPARGRWRAGRDPRLGERHHP